MTISIRRMKRGFDNIEMGAISYPPLTTINVPKQQLGVKAIQQLVCRINNPEKIYEDIRLNTNLIVRGSVKKLRKKFLK
ncbi:substrate-binding domain-containing protein [Thermoanaerobacter italicus]|uniref:substrate-binding domain-containing protein n=1 Tax=Thermoanaerobacter italicus TaxID=108150 RepID=UPI0001B0B28A|nr:substrate-binding domain-containing protein [Thermoanaerobacter italicus]